MSLLSEQSVDSWATRRQAVQLVKLGRALAALADDDPRVVAGSADLKYATLVAEFEDRHPDRFFQFGIAERNMFGAAAGMATTGLIPYVATFASFAGLLGYESMRTDLAYPYVPVRVLATHAGISMGFFSTSHHATEDIAALRSVADLMVLSPADGESAAELVRATVDHPGPIYFRLGRGREPTVYESAPANYRPGAPRVVRSGDDVLIAATGIMVPNAVEAAEQLAATGASATVLDVHTLKPFPAGEIVEHVMSHPLTIVVEEHNTEGGLGTMVLEAVAAAGERAAVVKHGVPDEYCIIGPPNHCYAYYGLDAAGIAAVATRALSRLEAGWWSGGAREFWGEDDRAAVLAAATSRNRAPLQLVGGA
jgi:transketolase